jgi:hypothetical protein
MTWSIRKVVVFGLCIVVVLFVASPIQGKDKVKLSGPEIQELLFETGVVTFGLNHKVNTFFSIVSHGEGKRNIFWRSLADPVRWGTDVTTSKVVGDQLCSKWTFGPKACYDIYRIGKDKYGSFLKGNLVATWYRGQAGHGETKKDKIKITGAELQDQFSKYAIFAGINFQNNVLWMLAQKDLDERNIYWKSFGKPDLAGSSSGSLKIVGDQYCSKWGSGKEKCFDFYRIGEDKYEMWLGGKFRGVAHQLK